ncbi:MAG: tetratricopeptide repeat protein [Taibaiella sp.]|nr:tetratricopeptide repeat protein [Taibaiella sp.]
MDDQQRWDSANALNQKGNYSQAIEYYQAIPGFDQKAEVLYNMGNAYLQSGQLGRAVWSYEKAYRLDPTDASIHHNLEAARQRIINPYRDQSFILSGWWQGVYQALPVNVWAVILLITGMGIGFILGKRKADNTRYRVTLSVSVILFLCIGSVLYLGILNLRDDSGVAIRYVNQLYGDRDLSQTLDRNLPEGTKVRILEADARMMKVRLPNGVEAYVSAENVAQL